MTIEEEVDREMRSNKIHTVIKNFAEMFPDEFAKTKIKGCGHCGASGLASYFGDTNYRYDDLNRFCEYCGFEVRTGERECPECGGPVRTLKGY